MTRAQPLPAGLDAERAASPRAARRTGRKARHSNRRGPVKVRAVRTGGGRPARGERAYTAPSLRASRAIRAAAWTLVAAGVAAPALRKRLKLPAPGVRAASG